MKQLQHLPSTNGARYTEAAWLLGQERYHEADSLVQAMPSEKNLKSPEEQERQRMLALISVLASAADDGRDAYRLNGSEVDELKTLVEAHYDRPAVWASNLLCAVYGECRAPYSGGTGGSKSGRTRQRNLEEPVVANPSFGVAPNPARDQVLLRYDFGDTAHGTYAVLRDVAGRLVVTLPLDGMVGQKVHDTTGLAPGTYWVQYMNGQQQVGAVPLLIQR